MGDHLLPIFEATCELGLKVFVQVTPNSRPFLLPPRNQAAFCLIGDDHHTSHGPDSLHAGSLRDWGERAGNIYCFAGAPVKEAYLAALATTLVLRRPSLVVECTTATELQCQRWARVNFPSKLCFIVTPKSGAML